MIVFRSLNQGCIRWTTATLKFSWWKHSETSTLKHNEQSGLKDRKALIAEVRACINARDVARGKEVHEKATRSGNDSSVYVATALVNMYAKFGSMVEARQVFDGVKSQDVVSWNALLSGYAENGEDVNVLDMFSRMKSQGCTPDGVTFVAALKACTSLAIKQDGGGGTTTWKEYGRKIHSEVGCHLDKYVQSTLVDMYAKWGSMDEAQKVFDDIQEPDRVSWTALILGYADLGEGETALDLFERMKSRGCAPDSVTFIGAIKACASLAVTQEASGKEECKLRGQKIQVAIQLLTYKIL